MFLSDSWVFFEVKTVIRRRHAGLTRKFHRFLELKQLSSVIVISVALVISVRSMGSRLVQQEGQNDGAAHPKLLSRCL